MGENVEFQSDGGNTPGYLAKPKSGHGPGIVVIQSGGISPSYQGRVRSIYE